MTPDDSPDAPLLPSDGLAPLHAGDPAPLHPDGQAALDAGESLVDEAAARPAAEGPSALSVAGRGVGASPRTGLSGPDLSQNFFQSPKERLIGYLLGACAVATIFTTLGIAAVLLYESAAFFSEVSPLKFLTDTQWTAQVDGEHWGIWPLFSGTLLITLIAGIVALPLGLAAAVYMAQYASERVRRWLKPTLELLAGVPTIVFGFFALTTLTPLLQKVIPGLQVYNALSAGLMVGLMVLPMVASLSEDALRAVPRALSEGAYALGATKIEVVGKVLIPAALSGIVASFILALSRAIGETMIVVVAAGSQPRLTLDPTASVQTMTAYIAQVTQGDAAQGTPEFQSLFAVGLALFLLTLALNLLANLIIRRYKEAY